jgi:hypothetical protein
VRQPFPITRESERRLHDNLSPLVGKRLIGVYYHHSSGEGAQRELSPLHVHEVDMELELQFENSLLLLVTWAMDGPTQGLDVELLAVSDAKLHATGSRDDMASTSEWRPIVGQQVEEVGIAWHESEEGPPEALWSIRLSFHNGASLVVVLGQLRDGQVQYIPDELIVIFDEPLARAYVSPLGSVDSFGETFIS